MKEEVERLIELYGIEAILDDNDVTAEEAVIFMVENGFIKLPEVQPVG